MSRARVYRRFLDFPLKCWRCFHALDVPNEAQGLIPLHMAPAPVYRVNSLFKQEP